ncbi:MAG: hypothetical protein HDQ88_08895 [Clostridia bacterium]|nr:hypothetical protein [Clostridia bacterium]
MTAKWTPSQSLANGSLRESTLYSRNAMIKITYFKDVPKYRIKILLEPVKNTPNTCLFSVFDDSYELDNLKMAQQKSLEILQQYLETIQTEIKEYLTKAICQRI